MKVLLTTDRALPEEAAHQMRAQFEDWSTSAQTVAILMDPSIHATAELPDGSWVRICHHEVDEPVEVPA